MSPRMGRPKAENPKSVDIKVRIEENTNAQLMEYAKEQNITRAEAIRRGIKLLLKK